MAKGFKPAKNLSGKNLADFSHHRTRQPCTIDQEINTGMLTSAEFINTFRALAVTEIFDTNLYLNPVQA